MENQAPEIFTPQQPKSSLALWIVIGVVILAIGIGIGLAVGKYSTQPISSPISSYENCVNTEGSIVQMSYPATCVTVDGQRFIQPLTDEEKQILQPPDLNREPTSSAATANWKTYTSTKFGISFNYPENLKTCLDQGMGSNFLEAKLECKPPYSNYFFKFEVFENTNDVPVYSGPGDSSAYETQGKQVVKLGSYQFTKQVFKQVKLFKWNDKEYPSGPTVIFYNLVDSEKKRLIEFYKSPASGIDEKTFDQILSTFKFVDK